jgi:hypothetical protein
MAEREMARREGFVGTEDGLAVPDEYRPPADRVGNVERKPAENGVNRDR